MHIVLQSSPNTEAKTHLLCLQELGGTNFLLRAIEIFRDAISGPQQPPTIDGRMAKRDHFADLLVNILPLMAEMSEQTKHMLLGRTLSRFHGIHAPMGAEGILVHDRADELHLIFKTVQLLISQDDSLYNLLVPKNFGNGQGLLIVDAIDSTMTFLNEDPGLFGNQHAMQAIKREATEIAISASINSVPGNKYEDQTLEFAFSRVNGAQFMLENFCTRMGLQFHPFDWDEIRFINLQMAAPLLADRFISTVF